MTRNVVIAIAIAMTILYLLFRRHGDINGAEARRLVHEGALLVDVRTPQEFATFHIPGAMNVPVQELERRMADLENKARPIVIYCQSGNRSGRAARMLKRAGYAEVHDLGAMTRW